MFIDLHRVEYGVEPICEVLPIAPSTYYRHVQLREQPDLRSTRVKNDELLRDEVRRVWKESFRTYGIQKVWRQLKADGIKVARCTVERLMREMGLQGVRRGKKPKTTIPSPRPCPLDLVQRNFRAPAPNRLWVADITYVPTFSGFVYVAFVTDVFSKKIVGWNVSSTLHTNVALDALNQAISERQTDEGLIHHSDRGAQYLSIRYSERLKESGLTPSVGSVGDSYDNALAETLNGLYKAELIHHQGPWKGVKDVERATMVWVHWFNTKRLYGPLGFISPQKYEEQFYRHHANIKIAA